MRFTYDPEVDALGARLVRNIPTARTQEVAPGVYLDWDRRGRLTGIEVLHASRHYARHELERLDDGTEWMTLAEAAEEGRAEGGPTAQTIRSLLNKGRLEGRKVGRDWQVARHVYWNYLENRSAAGRPGRRRDQASARKAAPTTSRRPSGAKRRS